MPLAYVLHFNMQENEKTEIISDVKTEIISASTMNAEVSPSMDKLEDFFSIKSKVGDGGMGVVYLAKDIRLNRYVAIKRLKPQFLVDAQIRKRFLHEAKAVASLNNANIVHIYFIGEDNDGPYFVMEYIEGAVVDTEHPNQPNPPQTLEQYIATNGVMNIDEAVDFMVKIIIYTGLSLHFDEAKEILDSYGDVNVVYKRPIQRGDLSLALKENPDIIAIIDGVFHQNSAVGHKEILNVMKNGIKVYGASSMGALRASELDSLGMVGVGYCYEQYANGNVDSDDEVAVMLDSESLEALSIPLISMRYVFDNAEAENIITESEKEELLSIAKKTFYPKRNYAQTLAQSSLDNDKKGNLINFIRESKDIKKEDAKDLLHLIKSTLPS